MPRAQPVPPTGASIRRQDMKFTTYTYQNPAPLPVEWDDGFSLQQIADEDVQAAGFGPDDEELNSGTLTEAWNGHPAGSVVLSGATVEGHPFALEQA